MSFVEIDNGYNIHYIEKGKGQPIVFLHGFLASSWVFQEQVDFFSNNYRAIAIDHLGHGNSDKPESDQYKIKDLANYVEQIVSKIIGNEKIVLVGHSMGGMIAQEYAYSKFSKRLQGLVLMSTTPKFHNIAMDQYRDDILSAKEELPIVEKDVVNMFIEAFFHRRYRKAHPGFIEEFTKKTFEIKNFVGFRTVREVIKFDSLNKIAKISAPTLILTSDKDILITPQDSEILNEMIPNSKLIKFAPRIGHYIQYEAKIDFHKELEKFLKTL